MSNPAQVAATALEPLQAPAGAAAPSTLARRPARFRPDAGPAHEAAPVPTAAGLVAVGLEAGLRLRAPRLHQSTPTVRRLAMHLCLQLGLDESHRKLVDVSARVRDIGMIGLPDDIVLSDSELSPEQREAVNRHPVTGAEILQELRGLECVAPIVRGHHEHWDGSGYPDGLAGTSIPLLSRVIAVADAFVAIACDRPHRPAGGVDVAIEQIKRGRGVQFDPQVVDALVARLAGKSPRDVLETAPASQPRPAARSSRPLVAVGANGEREQGAPGLGAAGLAGALRAFDHVPAFAPAFERAMAAASGVTPHASELVSAIEGSTSLTVAVLRAVQRIPGRRGIANVPDAIALLGPGGVAEVMADVPRIPFPWQTAEQALLYDLRVHGQTVARAAQRIAEEVNFAQRDELIAAALLHDVGKLVVARVMNRDPRAPEDAQVPPERRLEQERRQLHIDHATLGALLIERWGLPEILADAVRSHHIAEGGDNLATILRLADLVARHSLGHVVDRRVMLRLATACGISAQALRDVIFDLPQSGNQRRRAEPSPLSKRETDALRQLAAGKLYKDIAEALGVSASTVRSHLHSTYVKLGVEDRAQAVLRATEMGWI